MRSLLTMAFLATLAMLRPDTLAGREIPDAKNTKFIRGAFCTSPSELALDPQPHGPGPLTLRAVYCHSGDIGTYNNRAPAVSPDARHRATFGDPRGVLRIMKMSEKEASVSYDTGVAFDEWTLGSDPVVAWSSDSKFLWTARQERMRPTGGWALSPLQPVRASVSGHVTDLPQLEHPAGSLDGLLWVGGNGRALAQFGTRGGYYRPERPNPTPTFAIVDAAAGRVLDALPLANLEPLLKPKRHPGAQRLTRHVLATQLPDGRVRALLHFTEGWVSWNQGDPIQEGPKLPEARAYTLSGDGRMVLLTKPQTPGDSEVIVIASCGPPRHPPCRPRQRTEMTLAAMHDAVTGDVIWSFRWKFDPQDETPSSAISPDNRFALVGLVPTDIAENETFSVLYSKRRSIAVVSLKSGAILQTIPAPSGNYAMGFAEAGKTVWVQNVNSVTLYSVSGH
ncbi:MAG TPA: hypothetical protein VGD10_12665 [Allosphingosinicella sp.]|uniref:YncE family protein n=1 Tax=Allosphingosinicella sp. TaxID=2823234 RepID=UPI002EDBB38B